MNFPRVLLWLGLALTSTLPTVAATPSADFLAAVQARFAQWDLNHDGILATNELDAAVADATTTGTNAATLAALKRTVRATKPPQPALPPLTLEHLATLAGQPRSSLAKMYQEGLKRLAGATNRNLFAAGQPRLETIHQGKLGNCFCLAPLGALVHRDPAQVAAMFTLATNGGYQVQLGNKSVEIAPPTETEIAMASSNEGDGIWVNIYEKAAGTLRNEEQPENKRFASPLDALARGGSAGTMLACLTGHEIERFTFKFAKPPAATTNDPTPKLAELRAKLLAATQENRLMTTGTIKPTTPDLTPNHAYAVLAYDPHSDTVSLWNPHGQNFTPKGVPGPANGYPTTNGVFQIPLPEWVKQFSGMAFEMAATNHQPPAE